LNSKYIKYLSFQSTVDGFENQSINTYARFQAEESITMEPNRIAIFAKISAYTYQDPDQATPNFAELGYKTIKFFNHKGAQAYLLANDLERVLTFRGTEVTQPSDVLADLEAAMDPSESGGRVHQGFKGELDKLWNSIVEELDKENKTLYITGHSLGAAMATVATSRLQHKTATLVTFGSPRVGNKEFVDTLLTAHYRVQNNNDDVTKVPLLLMGYRHHGTNVYLNYYGFIRELTTWQKAKDMMRSRWFGIRAGEWFKGVSDHSITKYVSKLEKL
jgi:triacylglycerol lipase